MLLVSKLNYMWWKTFPILINFPLMKFVLISAIDAWGSTAERPVPKHVKANLNEPMFVSVRELNDFYLRNALTTKFDLDLSLFEFHSESGEIKAF